MQPKKKDGTWWPTPLFHVPKTGFLCEEMVTVAEISSGEKSGSTRDLYLALVDPKLAQELVESRLDSVSFSSSSGLTIGKMQRELEPLVRRWEGGGNVFVQSPTHEFLRAFDLVPRPVAEEDKSIVLWDDRRAPVMQVMRAEMTSMYDYPHTQGAKITVRRDYLLGYAEQTQRAVIALWYEWNDGPNQGENGNPYTAGDFADYDLPGRRVSLGPDPDDPNVVIAEFWGIRLVYVPGANAVTDVSLSWHGVASPVSAESAMKLQFTNVYVRDSVLDPYEKRPDLYVVHPESGAVTYSNTWSITYCHRVNRDLIELEIKKLYEGCPTEVVRHWHLHSVPPPKRKISKEPNVGTRAKRIVDGLRNVGQALSELRSITTASRRTPSEIIGLDFDALDRTWWYDHDLIRPITRRIPLDLGRDDFLDRCKDVAALVLEVSEIDLRQMLEAWGCMSAQIGSLGTLKLLDRINQIVAIVNESGLRIPEDFAELQLRYDEKVNALPEGQFLPSPISFLFTLYDIRLLAAHRGRNTKGLLKLLRITQADVQGGWGIQLDKVYDRTAEALESSASILTRYASRQ